MGLDLLLRRGLNDTILILVSRFLFFKGKGCVYSRVVPLESKNLELCTSEILLVGKNGKSRFR